MAYRLRWPLGIALCCLLAFIWIQTSLGHVQPRTSSELQRQASDLVQQINNATEAITREVRVDTLRRLLPREPGLVTTFMPAYTPAVTATLRDVIQAEVGDTQSLRARIGVFIVPGRLGFDPRDRIENKSLRWYSTGAIEAFAGSDEHGPFCLVVAADNRAPIQLDSPSPRSPLDGYAWRGGPNRPLPTDVLGGCHYWARYGAPGARVHEWLRGPGAWYSADYVAKGPTWPEERIRYVRGAFGFLMSQYRYGGTRLEAFCTLRNPEKCRRALVPENFRGNPFVVPGLVQWTRYGRNWWGESATTMLADVEHEFGPTRFARFWHSQADVLTAFQDAFGVRFEVWAMERMAKSYPTSLEGPRMAGATVLFSVLTIAALLGAALAISKARQV